MFNVYIYNEGDTLPEDDICYLIAKDGILLKKKVGLLESLAPVDKISILGDLKPTARLHIEKIPGSVFAKIYSFFKEVYKEYSSECIALLFYNPTTKKYKPYIPNQEVSGASLDYVKNRTFKDHMLMGSIHSHAGMTAFHSGTDKDDEVHWDGLHITLGKMNQDDILDISASIVANESRFIVDPLNYIENVELVEYTPYHPTHFRPGFTVIDGEKQYNKDVKSYIGYSIVGLSKKEIDFDRNWMKFVKRKTYQYQGVGYSKWVWDNELKKLVEVKVEGRETTGSVLDFHNGRQSWGGIYAYGMDGENWWERDFRNDEHTSNMKKEYNPCRDCIFRDYKLRKEDVNLALEPVNDHHEDKTAKSIDQELIEPYDEYGLYRYW